ncbi:MAG: sulfatase-like hydrolase/transferase, partial [Pirellulaceae bacterium]|nr:sulfatase-like hydrolase/transferase [Pirellulaceae bacterium]
FGPDVVCDFLLNFIDQNRERPFLVYYPMMLPHWPFIPTPDSPLGGSRERKGKYDGRPGGEEYFPDMVAYLDSLVGRIDAKLAEVGVRDNTLLIFTADNGCAINIVSRRGDEVIKGGKGSMPDAGTHAPLIASWPAVIEKATVNDSLVDFSDVLPTLLDVAGVRTPSELKTDGLSFLPQLKGAAEGRRQWVFCHYNPRPPRATADPKKKQQALNKLTKLRTQKQLGRFARTQQFKLYDDGRFYDVAADVLESRAIDVGVATTKVKRVHEMLQKVLDSQPEFQYFAAAGAKKKTNKKQPANKQ